jgi:hypothetical protein
MAKTSKSPQVPNTISDQQWADLRRRAEKAAPPMFSDKAVAQRLASSQQRAKRAAS